MRKVSTWMVTLAALSFGAGGALAADVTPQAANYGASNYADTATQPSAATPYGGEAYLDPRPKEAEQLPTDVFFVRYDTDGDGDLSDEETVMRTRAELEAEIAGGKRIELHDDHSVRPIDRNGDGVISADEWVMENSAYRGDLDLNNNGIPDGQE